MANKIISVLVVEDEPIIAMDIASSITDLGYKSLGIAVSGEKAVVMARELKPDLILMDIQLQGKINGIEATRRIKAERDVPVIYLTSQADRATINEAVDTQPQGYILKPFDESQLYSNIQIAMLKWNTNIALAQTKTEESIFIKTDKQLQKINLKDILYLESEENYVMVHTRSQRIMTRATLADIELSLPKKLYVRIHRRYIVQLNCIKTIRHDTLLLDEGTALPIGKVYKDELTENIDVKTIS